MSWIRHIFIFLVINSLTGTCFSLLWLAVSRLLARHDAKLLYRCLKIVMLFYILPVTYILISFYDSGRTLLIGSDSTVLFFNMTPILFVVTETIILVWFLIMLTALGMQIRHMRKWRAIRSGNIPEEDGEIIRLFEEVCERLQIKGKVALARNDLLAVPVIAGMFHPVVILPCVGYTREELEIIFTHELMHYEKKDLWVKMTALIVAVIYCFNPLTYQLLRSVNRWSEVNCDIAVCEALAGKYSARTYYEMILAQMLHRKKGDYYLTSAMAESNSEIIRRIRQMKHYQRENGYGRKKSAALLAAFMTAGLCLSIGVSGMTAKAQEKLYEVTVEEQYIRAASEDMTSEDVLAKASVSGLQEEVLPEGANVIELPFDFNPFVRSQNVPIDWKVPKDTYVQTKEYNLSAGDKVTISLSFDPDNLYMKAGLVYPDLTMKYDDGYGAIGYTFTIEEGGKYRFYIHNKSKTTEVHATGSVLFVTSNF